MPDVRMATVKNLQEEQQRMTVVHASGTPTRNQTM